MDVFVTSLTVLALLFLSEAQPSASSRALPLPSSSEHCPWPFLPLVFGSHITCPNRFSLGKVPTAQSCSITLTSYFLHSIYRHLNYGCHLCFTLLLSAPHSGMSAPVMLLFLLYMVYQTSRPVHWHIVGPQYLLIEITILGEIYNLLQIK